MRGLSSRVKHDRHLTAPPTKSQAARGRILARAQDRPMRNRLVGSGHHWPSKPASGQHEAIEAQIGDEIAMMQGVMISDLRQDEHLVRPGTPEVRRAIEVRIGRPVEAHHRVISPLRSCASRDGCSTGNDARLWKGRRPAVGCLEGYEFWLRRRSRIPRHTRGRRFLPH